MTNQMRSPAGLVALTLLSGVAAGMILRLALLSSVIVACLGQSNTATINGAINDAQAAVIQGADVMAINDATGIRTAAKTNDSGFYSIPNLPIGVYTLTVEKQGFRRYVWSGIVLTTSQVLELDATLELGAINETVNVTALGPLVNTRTSDVTQLIDSKSIEGLPLGNRRTMNIIQMTGGAVVIANDNLPTYALAGGRIQSQMVWIDGGTGQNIRIGAGQQNVDPPVETVQEIKVLINSYSAEYGGSAGGVVIQTTKSGNNHMHGSAYEYLRNDAMDAPGFFAPVRNGAKLAPELRYNVFGGTAGGPIRRNKTFFFAAYEGTRRRTGATTTLTVPTELQRTGDFSQTFNARGGLIPIYDPTTVPRQPFPDNVIPNDRLDPVALNVVNYFPHANRPADTTTGANNFRSNAVTAVTGDFLMGKVDQSLNEKNKLTGRYIRYSQNTDPSSVYPDPGADPATHSHAHSQYAYGSWTSILSSTKVNDLRFTYVNRVSQVISPGVGGNYPEKIGLTGVDQHAFPQFQFSSGSYSPIGSASQERRQSPIEQHQVVDNLTFLKNRHALKFGFEGRLSRNYEVNLSTVSGAFSFTTQPTGLPSNAVSTGNGLASLLLGFPTSFSEMVTPALDRHSWYFSGFLDDDWTATGDLTLNIGVRWELDTPIFDANLHMNGFNRNAINPVSGTPGTVKFAGVNGYPEHPYEFDSNNFGPRFGFAWKPLGSQNTVIRGGYGIFFAHPLDSAQPTAASLGFSVSAALTSPDSGLTAPFLLRNGVPPVKPASPALNDAYGAARPGQNPPTAVSYFERDRVSGYAHQFNLTLQRELPGSIVVEAVILGNLGRKLSSANLSINQIQPQVLGPEHHSQADRPFPQFSDVILLAPSIGITNYYAGLFKVEKRLPHDLNLVSTYTWSKFLGNTNDTANPGAGSLGQNNGPYSNYYNRRADYGPVESDLERRFTLSFVYELPFGRGRHWLARGLPGYLAGGWAIGALTSIQSGPPLTAITAIPQTSNGFSAGPQRASVAHNPNLPSNQRSVTRWFDTDAFSQPSNYTFGNEGVGIIRASGWFNCDFSLLRNFAVTEHARLQLRGEFFNAINHTNLNPPRVAFGSTFGVISSAGPARQIQVAARLVF